MQFSPAVLTALIFAVANAAPADTLAPEISSALTNAEHQWSASGVTLQHVNIKAANDDTPPQIATSLAGLTTAVDGSNSALENVSKNCFFWHPFIIHYEPRPVPMPMPPYYDGDGNPCPPGYEPVPYGSGGNTAGPDVGVSAPHSNSASHSGYYTHYDRPQTQYRNNRQLFPMKFTTKPMKQVQKMVVHNLQPLMGSVSHSVDQLVPKVGAHKHDARVHGEAQRLLASIDNLHLNTHELADLGESRNSLAQASQKLKQALV